MRKISYSKLGLFIFCISCYSNLFSQNKKIDSLSILVNSHTTIDSSFVKNLKKIGDAYYEINFDSTKVYYHKVLEKAPLVPYFDIQLSTLRSLGYTSFRIENNYDLGLKYFIEALELTRVKNDTIGYAYMLSDLGWAYWKMGQPIQALEKHLQVKDIAEKHQHKRLTYSAYLNLGIIQNEEGENEKAIQFYQKALNIAIQAKYLKQIGMVNNNIGKAFQDDKVYDKALSHFEKADSIFSELKNNHWLSLSQYNKGNNYLFRNKPKTALVFYQKALEYNAIGNDKEREAMILTSLSKAYQNIDEIQNSISTAEKALRISKELNTPNYNKDLFQTLAESYNLIGDYYLSNKYYNKYNDFIEKNSSNERSTKIAKINNLYESERKEKQILELENKRLLNEKQLAKIQSQHQLLGLGFIIFILGSLLFLFFRKSSELKRMDQLKTNLSENLHDNIGASLNHIKMLSNQLYRKESDPKEKNKTLTKIKTISNQMMYDLYDMLWTLKKEKSTLGDLIEKLQDHADNILSDFHIPYQFFSKNISEKNILTTKEKMNIYSIFKESINNILKHTHPNEVIISLEKGNGKHFQMKVINIYTKENNEETISNKKGIINMKNRAEEINGNLEIINGDNQFEVILSV